ncbi:MAG TPA: isoaspartyl peptidase/L-asparaginase [Flavobacteriaceae bacterium]|nr:isoaspartyl peptidase/L-asparaginase [Flavobacteriaceae bacterium]
MQKFTIAIHGGAGTIVKDQMTSDQERQYKNVLEKALDASYDTLKKGGTAIDAVEIAVQRLEDSTLFNAGKGSVFTEEGTHEMDASIMDGKTLKAGAISLISGIKNPVRLARDVMEKSQHVFLAGKGAMDFAEELNYKLESPDYFFDEFRYRQWQGIKDSDQVQLDHRSDEDSKYGTVGAVACDQAGNVAAATSTGGMTNKKLGRIGDSPIIGAGNYANNKTCAISCTGIGEFFMRSVAAYDVSCLMEFKGLSLKEAAEEVIHQRILKMGGKGGLIGVDSKGNFIMPFNTEGMYRAARTSKDKSNPKGMKMIKIYKE